MAVGSRSNLEKCSDQRQNSRVLVRLQDRRDHLNSPVTRANTYSGLLSHSGDVRRPETSFFSVMQQTLLIQIFPDPGGHSSSGDQCLQCPTCSVFSARCCQSINGWSVLAGIVSTNGDSVWQPALVRTLSRLRYQVSSPCPHNVWN